MQKRVDCDSFNYGTDLPLVHIADDKDVLRKTASSSVVDQWGDIEPIKGHTLIHLTALGDYETTGFNHNADGFRAAFCKKAHPTFIKNGALYRNHKAEKGKEEGYVVKTAHNDNMGRTELLVAANHNKCADWLSDIEANRPVKFSMGFNCTAPGDECSICGHMAANRKHYCEHTKKGAAAPYGMGRILPDGRKVGVFNDHGYWNDISRVPVGADAIAMDLRKIASFQPDEVIGGAEMAELYNMKLAAPDIDREILAHKISNIEKRVDMAGFATPFIPSGKQRKMSKVDVDALRNAKVAAMFGQLSKTGAVLPMEVT